jgi:solute:Na+ symporter, SSS family
MTFGKLAPADTLMVIGYFILMLGIGAYFARRMRRMKDFFSGGNSIPWWLSGVSFYMSSFSVAAFVFYPGLCYRHGWVGVTLLWVAIPAVLFSAYFFSARWRRARIDSPVEYLETRYSGLLRQLFAWQGVPVKMIDDGIKLVATGTFVSIATGLDIRYSIVSIGAIILLYTFMGGLWAVTVTDFIQFVVLAVGVIIILPLSISKAGGMTAIFDNVPDGFFNLTSAEFGWSYIIPLVLLYALAWSSTMWPLIQRYYCVPKERDALKVGWLVAILYVVGPPLMFFPAIAATQFMPGVEDAGQIYPLICVDLLPAGMLGLIIAAMFAATMSTLSSDYNVCAGVLTNDVYKRLIRPGASERELVHMGRIMTLVIGVVALITGVVIASIGNSEGLFKMMVTLFGISAAPAAVPMLLGLLSRKVTNLSAILGFVCGTLTGIGLFILSKHGEDAQFLGILWDHGRDSMVFGPLALNMEIVMFLGTALVTTLVMFVVCAIAPSKAAAQARTDAFLKRLKTPIGDLPEDEPAGDASEIPSPFGVVGVSVALIGALLIAVLPWVWVEGGAVFMLDAVLGVLLLLGGGLVVWASRRSRAT